MSTNEAEEDMFTRSCDDVRRVLRLVEKRHSQRTRELVFWLQGLSCGLGMVLMTSHKPFVVRLSILGLFGLQGVSHVYSCTPYRDIQTRWMRLGAIMSVCLAAVPLSVVTSTSKYLWGIFPLAAAITEFLALQIDRKGTIFHLDVTTDHRKDYWVALGKDAQSLGELRYPVLIY